MRVVTHTRGQKLKSTEQGVSRWPRYQNPKVPPRLPHTAVIIKLTAFPPCPYSPPRHTRLSYENPQRPAAALKPVNAALLARGGDIKPPPALYDNAVEIGAKKAAGTPTDTLLLGIISGCHIAFGGLLAVTIGANIPAIKVTLAVVVAVVVTGYHRGVG